MELALPQNWDVAFFKKPLGNKGLSERSPHGKGFIHHPVF